MPELNQATVTIGVPGLNGTGITAGEKTALTNDTTALKAATYITQTANATLSAEQALSSLATGLVKVTTATGVLSTAVAADLPSHTHTQTDGRDFIIDGGGATITTGVKGDIEIKYACTMTAWRVLADQSGLISVGIWRDSYANFPPTVADLLTTPAITVSGTKNSATGLSHALVAGDILRFNVTSVTSIQRVTIALTWTRT